MSAISIVMYNLDSRQSMARKYSDEEVSYQDKLQSICFCSRPAVHVVRCYFKLY